MPYRDTYVDDHNYQASAADPLPSSYPLLWYALGFWFAALSLVCWIFLLSSLAKATPDPEPVWAPAVAMKRHWVWP